VKPRTMLREPLAFLGLAALVLILNLAAGGAAPATGQDVAESPPGPVAENPAAPAVPTATLPPGFLPCGGAAAYFTLTNNNPHVGEQIGWWAAGFATNSMVIVTVRDMLNPNATDSIVKTTAMPNNWCQAMGTLSFPLPIQYEVKVEGVSSMTGQQVSLVSYPFAIPALLPTPTPVPLLSPSPPANVRMTQVSRTSARVEWDDNSSNEAGFVVMTRVGEFRTAPNTTTMTIGNLETNQLHCFRVYAFNNAGRSIADVDCLHIRPLQQ
jgi:hypothetical protein